MEESSDKTWSTGEGNGKPLQYSCLENPMNNMKRTSFIIALLPLNNIRGLTGRFPDSSVGKESIYNVGDSGLIPGLGRSPGRGHGNPLQYSCLENPHGQKSLAGYSPWAVKSQTGLSD